MRRPPVGRRSVDQRLRGASYAAVVPELSGCRFSHKSAPTSETRWKQARSLQIIRMTNWLHRTAPDGLANAGTPSWLKAMLKRLLPSLMLPNIEATSAHSAEPVDSELGELVAGRLEQHFSSNAFDAPEALRWPDIEAMLQNDFTLTWSRRAKYRLRLWRTRDVRQRLLDVCARMPFAAALLGTRPRAFHPLMNHLLDRRLGAEARLIATLASLRRVCQSMSAPSLDQLLTHDLTLITLTDGMRISFSLSGVSFHEGLWQIGMITASGKRLYSLGFGFTDGDTILIANVQGPSLGLDGLALIREATHAAHGMRPAHLLLHALRLLAVHWGVKALFGVDPQHHVKGRWNLRRSRLRFDYRAFWTEIGGRRHHTGNWSVPLVVETRALETVPAKRRAMYRRRYEMLAQLEHAVVSLRAESDRPECTSPRAGCTQAPTAGAEPTQRGDGSRPPAGYSRRQADVSPGQDIPACLGGAACGKSQPSRTAEPLRGAEAVLAERCPAVASPEQIAREYPW